VNAESMTFPTLLLAQATNVTWYLIPLAMIVSLVYSASRFELPDRILRRAAWLFLQIIGFMSVVFVILWILSYKL
jgi:hypothetical protein